MIRHSLLWSLLRVGQWVRRGLPLVLRLAAPQARPLVPREQQSSRVAVAVAVALAVVVVAGVEQEILETVE